MTPLEQAREALQSPLSDGPTWALIERYADAVCDYNTAVRIDVGIDKAGAECLAIEKELRAHLAALSAPQGVPQPADRVRECAQRLVDGASWNLGGTLSDKSKASDIPSKAYSQVKARHLASLRDAIAAAPAAPKQAEAQTLLPERLMRFLLRDLKAERADLEGFLSLGNEVRRAAEYDEWIAAVESYCQQYAPAAPQE